MFFYKAFFFVIWCQFPPPHDCSRKTEENLKTAGPGQSNINQPWSPILNQ